MEVCNQIDALAALPLGEITSGTNWKHFLVKVKVKFALEQTTKAQMGSRSIAIAFF
jgi:hypothetical protein